MCAHVIAVTTSQFSVFSDCEHLVVWVSVLCMGKSEGRRSLENQFGTVGDRFLGAEV